MSPSKNRKLDETEHGEFIYSERQYVAVSSRERQQNYCVSLSIAKKKEGINGRKFCFKERTYHHITPIPRRNHKKERAYSSVPNKRERGVLRIG